MKLLPLLFSLLVPATAPNNAHVWFDGPAQIGINQQFGVKCVITKSADQFRITMKTFYQNMSLISEAIVNLFLGDLEYRIFSESYNSTDFMKFEPNVSSSGEPYLVLKQRHENGLYHFGGKINAAAADKAKASGEHIGYVKVDSEGDGITCSALVLCGDEQLCT